MFAKCLVWKSGRSRFRPKSESGGRLCKKQNRAFAKILVAQFQFLRDRLVAAEIRGLQIIQQAAALANHHQESAPRAVVLFVGLQMLGQMVDALRQQGNLHIGGTRVFVVRLKLFNRFRLCFHNQ